MIETSLASLERLGRALGDTEGFDWARRLLLLGLASRFGSEDAIAQVRGLASPGVAPARRAGGDRGRRDRPSARGADARLCRAPRVRVRRLRGDAPVRWVDPGRQRDRRRPRPRVRRADPDHRVPPRAAPGRRDPRPDYDELRTTPGSGFSPLEPLQNWIDLVASGIPPAGVRVLGVNGGRIAALEYRMALALGATVGLVADSGREAGRLLGDERWTSPRLLRLPVDPRDAPRLPGSGPGAAARADAHHHRALDPRAVPARARRAARHRPVARGLGRPARGLPALQSPPGRPHRRQAPAHRVRRRPGRLARGARHLRAGRDRGDGRDRARQLGDGTAPRRLDPGAETRRRPAPEPVPRRVEGPGGRDPGDRPPGRAADPGRCWPRSGLSVRRVPPSSDPRRRARRSR